jgi:hypothetical protein
MGRNGASARAGMTLLELILVMFLLALVLGGGLGFFAALDLGRRQAAGLVKSVLRSAQNTAIARTAPARVRIERATGTIQAESLLVVGTYHFEQRSLAGYGPEGRADPELFSEDGFVGAAFRPGGKLGATAEIPLERDPACDFTRGFALECALWLERAGDGRVLTLGRPEQPTLALEVNRAGALRGRFQTRSGEATSAQRGGQAVIVSAAGLVPVERWVRVRMQYDREHLSLLLDGVPVASQEEQAFVWKTEGGLVLSDRTKPLQGKIDSLVIAAMVVGEPGILPEDVRFAEGSAERIEFAAGGTLDRSFHADPPRIVLEFADGAREAITVGFYGTVQ